MGVKKAILPERAGRVWKSNRKRAVRSGDDDALPRAGVEVRKDGESKAVKTLWSQISDFAKWATVITAMITFLTLLSDWLFYQGWSLQFGVEELVSNFFSGNPVHFRGVIIIVQMMVGYAIEGMLIWAMMSLLELPALRKRFRFQVLVFVLVLSAILVFAAVTVSSGSDPYRSLIEAFKLMSVPYMVGLALVMFCSFSKRDIAEFFRRRLNLFGFGMIGISLLLTIFLIPLSAGGHFGSQIKNGNIASAGMCITTKGRFSSSPNIEAILNEDKTWTLCPKPVASPSGYLVPSLQYLGANQSGVYLVEIGIERTYIIPSEQVLAKELLNPILFKDASFSIVPK